MTSLAIPEEPPFLAFVDLLPLNVSKSDVENFFKDIPIFEISLFYIEVRRFAYAFVEFESQQALKDALSKNFEEMNGEPIKVVVAADNVKEEYKKEIHEKVIRSDLKSLSLPLPTDDFETIDIFNFDFLLNDDTINYIQNHGKVAFFIRGPPETRKSDLYALIKEFYPRATVYSANLYFQEPFIDKYPFGKQKEKHLLGMSHKWCLEKLINGLRRGEPCLIVSNTHVTQWEVDYYLMPLLNFAYTVIMVDTPWKVNTDFKVLARSTDRPLGEKYFKHRATKWVDNVPWYTGWFLNPADASALLNKALLLAEHLDQGDLRADWNLGIQIKGINDYYVPKKEVFCICFYCQKGEHKNGVKHYLNPRVTDVMGKLYGLTVVGFIIEPQYLLAIVKLDPEQKGLATFIPSIEKDDFPSSIHTLDPELFVSAPSDQTSTYGGDTESLYSGITVGINALRVSKRNIVYVNSAVHEGNSRLTLGDGETNMVEEMLLQDSLELSSLSVIILATSKSPKPGFPHILNVRNFLSKILVKSELEAINLGQVPPGHLYKGSGEKQHYVFFPEQELVLKSIFTGLY